MAWEAREGSILQAHSILPAHIISGFITTGIISFIITMKIVSSIATTASSLGSVTRSMGILTTTTRMITGTMATLERAYSDQYWTDLTAAVQTELARGGYYHGAIDGVVSSDTLRAIRVYRKAKGLPVNSQIDRRLLRSLDI